jgi:hypothetical protein
MVALLTSAYLGNERRGYRNETLDGQDEIFNRILARASCTGAMVHFPDHLAKGRVTGLPPGPVARPIRPELDRQRRPAQPDRDRGDHKGQDARSGHADRFGPRAVTLADVERDTDPAHNLGAAGGITTMSGPGV